MASTTATKTSSGGPLAWDLVGALVESSDRVQTDVVRTVGGGSGGRGQLVMRRRRRRRTRPRTRTRTRMMMTMTTTAATSTVADGAMGGAWMYFRRAAEKAAARRAVRSRLDILEGMVAQTGVAAVVVAAGRVASMCPCVPTHGSSQST
jgi:hypothetical protein